jgi:hypothetical protein
MLAMQRGRRLEHAFHLTLFRTNLKLLNMADWEDEEDAFL